MVDRFIVEQIDDICVEENFRVKDTVDKWFFLTDSKIKADWLCDKMNSLSKGETVDKLNDALQEVLLDNVQLREKYDRETEFLIKENVKLKHELAEYKKNGE